MLLVELNEGTRKELVNGDLQEIVAWLNDNQDEYTWQLEEDQNAIMPDLTNIETLQDLTNELNKINLGWWDLVVEL